MQTMIVLTILLLASGAAANEQERPATADLPGRRTAFFAAIAAKDAVRTGEFFAEDAVVQTADMPPVRGRGAIQKFYTTLFGFLVSMEAASDAMRIASSDDMAYDVGRAQNTFRSKDGTLTYEGKYLLVWIRQEGVWRIAAYSVSSNRP